MQVAILVFDGLTVLDAVGPYEVLSWIPDADVRLVGIDTGPKRNHKGTLALVADWSLDDVPRPDVVVVPGGPGEEALRWDAHVLDWLRKAHETSEWTTSVCTGALLLAAAGILDGVEATTHWASIEQLAMLGATPVRERVVIRDKVITAAGVSAGIDMALRLTQMIAGDDIAQAIQLVMEYDPQPPFDAGSPDRAPAHIVDLVSRQT
ncbi:MAG: DJ-1/PfpI family protein [Actinomycetota bacterium]|nr:DJ-1/PfpI family protein [Actinomycetota bacterium]